jgi:ribokinase
MTTVHAMTTVFDVCVVGSANLDLVANVDRLPGPGETVTASAYAEHAGGKGLNQAVAAARAGAAVAFVGAVGSDAAGEVLRAVLCADGIDATALCRVDGPTGRALIGVAANGENSIIVVSGANASLTADMQPKARVVLAQLEVPLAAVARALAAGRAGGAITMLNPAPAVPLDASLLALCDVVVPNEHEVTLLGGVQHLLALGARAVVVTLGSRGADLHTAQGVTRIQPFLVTPVDTTAAGDAFCGAFAARLAAGDEMAVALRYAAAAGALATTVAGAVPSLPRDEAVRRLLTSRG